MKACRRCGWAMGSNEVGDHCLECKRHMSPSVIQTDSMEADIQNLRQVLSLILDILSRLNDKQFGNPKDFDASKDAFAEARALLGTVARSEMIHDLKKWEEELNG